MKAVTAQKKHQVIYDEEFKNKNCLFFTLTWQNEAQASK